MLKMTKPAEDYESEYHQRELTAIRNLCIAAMIVLIAVGMFALVVL